MPRRQSPTVLLYGFGLVLLLSLGFNFFLLVDKSERQSRRPEQNATLQATGSADSLFWQDRLQAFSRQIAQKDSLIQALKRTSQTSNDTLVAH